MIPSRFCNFYKHELIIKDRYEDYVEDYHLHNTCMAVCEMQEDGCFKKITWALKNRGIEMNLAQKSSNICKVEASFEKVSFHNYLRKKPIKLRK